LFSNLNFMRIIYSIFDSVHASNYLRERSLIHNNSESSSDNFHVVSVIRNKSIYQITKKQNPKWIKFYKLTYTESNSVRIWISRKFNLCTEPTLNIILATPVTTIRISLSHCLSTNLIVVKNSVCWGIFSKLWQQIYCPIN